ncbi:MAG: hypothetical protein HQL37_07790 [Alphaproteobacteria bacterium]|nr:hypothetical protein [Alphaproteobacteria bacterium]
MGKEPGFFDYGNGDAWRTIGMARAKAKIGLENFTYDMSRFTFLMGCRA